MRPPQTTWLPPSVFALCAALGSISCQSLPEGYWTREDRSLALTNQEYPADSQRCEELAARDGSGQSDAYRAGLFTRCMQATGYQWVVQKSRSRSGKTALEPSPDGLACTTGRLVTDAFGYPSCVPVGPKDRGVLSEAVPSKIVPPEAVLSEAVPSETVSPETVLEAPRQTSGELIDILALEPTPQPVARRAMDDGLCRQYAKESLSSTYSVYTQCMQDKGWNLKPGH